MRHEKKAPKADAPCACLLFPIMNLVEGVVFYCDYYPTSCDDTPEAAYAVEEYSTPWPYQTCGCDLCFATSSNAKKQRKNDRKFLGLPTVVDSNYQHDGLVPQGKARECTTILIDPKLEYLQFPLGKETVYAKVLVFSWKTGQATDGNPKNLATRMRHIAFQTASVRAGAKCEAVTAAPIFSDENPSYAYQCAHQSDGGEPTQVLVLLAKQAGQ